MDPNKFITVDGKSYRVEDIKKNVSPCVVPTTGLRVKKIGNGNKTYVVVIGYMQRQYASASGFKKGAITMVNEGDGESVYTDTLDEFQKNWYLA